MSKSDLDFQCGTLLGVETNKDGTVEKLIVKFDTKNAEEDNVERVTLIMPTNILKKNEYEYFLSKQSNTVIGSIAKVQYPQIGTVTVNKIQGQTIDGPWKCVIDIRSVFEGAQRCVMASRVKELEQLYILEDLTEKQDVFEP